MTPPQLHSLWDSLPRHRGGLPESHFQGFWEVIIIFKCNSRGGKSGRKEGAPYAKQLNYHERQLEEFLIIFQENRGIPGESGGGGRFPAKLS